MALNLSRAYAIFALFLPSTPRRHTARDWYALLAANKIETAKTVLGRLTYGEERLKACRALGRAFIELGAPERLRDWADSFDKPSVRIACYLGAAEQMASDRDAQGK